VFVADPIAEWLTVTGFYNLRSHGSIGGTEAGVRIDPVLAAVIDGAASVSALDVVRAQDACHILNLRLVELFHDVRLLLTPTVAAAPPPLALEGSALINGTADFNWVKFTYPFNMTRSPAASVCVGLTEGGLPVGLQLVGPQHADIVVLRSAAALEAAIGFDTLARFPGG
jgi:aspartyl-tRNA(Asn)/glutamyl-tRNA(Gln) amidotransferase subunit A